MRERASQLEDQSPAVTHEEDREQQRGAAATERERCRELEAKVTELFRTRQ
jgi:hypothetical protein